MKGFEFYQDIASEWRWRLLDDDDENVANSAEGYKNKVDCQRSAELFKTLGPKSDVIKEGDGHNGNGPIWEYFQDASEKWRWRFQAANNRIIAISSGAEESEDDIKEAIEKVKALLLDLGHGGGSGKGGNGGGGYVPPSNGGSSGPGRFA